MRIIYYSPVNKKAKTERVDYMIDTQFCARVWGSPV